MSFNKSCMYPHHDKNNCCIPKCPPPPCSIEEDTLSSGPIAVIDADNRVEFFIINPTNEEATVTVEVTNCTAPTPPNIPTIPGTVVSFSSRQVTIFGPIAITVPAGDCFEGGVAIPTGTNIVDAIFTGEFAICDFAPAQGGLEVSVAVGPGRISGGLPQPGLSQISTFVSFGNMVIAIDEGKKCR